MENENVMAPAPILQELVLDTKGTCAFCLVSIDAKQIAENCLISPPHVEEICLRSLCRLLRIDLKTIWRRALDGSCPADLMTCDFSVKLCANCGNITEGLTELMRQLEQLQMQVDYKLQQFHQIFGNSEIEGRWKVVKDKLLETTNEETVVETKILEQLRLETRIKCGAVMAKRLKTRVPVVRLNRLRSKSRSPSPPPVIRVRASRVMTPWKAFINRKSEEYLKNVKFLDQIARNRNYICLLCNAHIANNSPREHLMVAHPDLCFAKLQLPTVTKEQFQTCCKFVVTWQVSKAGKVTRQGRALYCPLCQKICAQGQHLRKHLMLEHKESLERQITEIQASGKIPNWIPQIRHAYGPRYINMPENTVNDQVSKPEPIRKQKADSNHVDDEWRPNGIRKTVKNSVKRKGLGENRKTSFKTKAKQTAFMKKHGTHFVCMDKNGCGKRFVDSSSLQLHREKHCSFQLNYKDIVSNMITTGKLACLKGSRKTREEILESVSHRREQSPQKHPPHKSEHDSLVVVETWEDDEDPLECDVELHNPKMEYITPHLTDESFNDEPGSSMETVPLDPEHIAVEPQCVVASVQIKTESIFLP